MKKLIAILRIGVYIALFILISSCTRDDESINDGSYKFPKFGKVSNTLVKDKLEFPAGLSENISGTKSYSGVKGETETNALFTGFFVEGPTFQRDYSKGGFKPYTNPKISSFSGDLINLLSNLATNTLSEFDLTNYLNDFDSFDYFSKEDSIFRPSALLLTNRSLKDGTLLASSNSSDKIFKISLLGGVEVYLKDSELERITDMIQGSDGRIYIAQAPLIDENTHEVISPKKISSINNKTIKTEFEIPYDPNSSHAIPSSWSDIWKEAPFLERLKIIENSEAGKKNFAIEFYVSDLLGDAIYKVDSKNNVSLLAEHLKYPSSLAVDSAGTVFYTTSPLWRYPLQPINYPASLYALNPETGSSKLLCEFGSRDFKDYLSGEEISVKYPGVTHFLFLPLGFNVTNIFYEEKDKCYFLLSNSHEGTFNLVTVNK